MYCPVCFNDTLKFASSGVVKLSFNGKSKSTSQLFYNMSNDKEKEILHKLDTVVGDYFKYYQGFQNKDPIKFVEAFSIDFKCSNNCVIQLSNRVNVIGLLFSKKQLEDILTKSSKKFDIPINLKIIL